MCNKKNNYLIYLIILLIIIIIIILLYKYLKHKFVEGFENKIYSEGLNNAEKILFINLEKRKDRLESITSELKKQNVSTDKIHRINAHYTPGNGHLGCAKSHYDAMQYAIDNNLENVIVFEDDFIFSRTPDETKKKLNDLFNNIDKKEWDVVMFSHSYGEESNTKYPFINKVKKAQTSSGYIVNKNYFKTLQDVFKESSDNMKQEKTSGNNYEYYALDQVWKKNQERDNWFCFNPLLGKQDDTSNSTIQEITNYNKK